MKILIDENLPPRLARALDELFADEHEVIHLRTKFGRGVKDITWIDTLSRAGHWVVISADRRITRNRAEYRAFRNSRLLGFFLSKSLYKSKLAKQAEKLLFHWDAIADLSTRVQGGAMFELPIRGKVRQLKL